MRPQRTTLPRACAHCQAPIDRRKFCGRECYQASRLTAAEDPSRRALSKIDASGDCWLWMGERNGKGYGRLPVRKGDRVRLQTAHRLVWEILCGPIPPGHQLDHLCRVRLCVNPDHLEPVPPRVNGLRGYSFAAVNARKAACKRGHINWQVRPQGNRRCLTCQLMRSAKHAHSEAV